MPEPQSTAKSRPRSESTRKPVPLTIEEIIDLTGKESATKGRQRIWHGPNRKLRAGRAEAEPITPKGTAAGSQAHSQVSQSGTKSTHPGAPLSGDSHHGLPLQFRRHHLPCEATPCAYHPGSFAQRKQHSRRLRSTVPRRLQPPACRPQRAACQRPQQRLGTLHISWK